MKFDLPVVSAICIDDGNTRCKVGIFISGKLHQQVILPKPGLKDLLTIKEIKEASLPLIWSSVSSRRKIFLSLSKKFTLAFEAGRSLRLPLKNRYRSPGPGSDRLCAAVAAHTFFPGLPVLAVDAGTCLKFDFVDGSGAYLGGSISPGLQMRYDAMHQGTGLLPALKPSLQRLVPCGANTQSAMHSGARLGQLFEMETRILHYRKKYPGLRVFLTGGDIKYLPISLKKNIFAEPNLVLYGLIILLSHQPKIKALNFS